MSNRDAERLLPKPGGFEGFGWLVKEGLEAKQLAVSDLKEDPHWLIERDAAPPAVEADMAQCGDEISRVAPLLDCHFPLVELLVDLPQVATDARSAAHGLPQDPTHEHHVGVDLLVREHALAGVPPFEHVPGEFDVLLRHHPHPISRGQYRTPVKRCARATPSAAPDFSETASRRRDAPA